MPSCLFSPASTMTEDDLGELPCIKSWAVLVSQPVVHPTWLTPWSQEEEQPLDSSPML